MTTKVPKGFRDAYARYPHKQWFYKVVCALCSIDIDTNMWWQIDDDTFVVMHNLLNTLNRYDWREVQYIGHRMNIGGTSLIYIYMQITSDNVL